MVEWLITNLDISEDEAQRIIIDGITNQDMMRCLPSLIRVLKLDKTQPITTNQVKEALNKVYRQAKRKQRDKAVYSHYISGNGGRVFIRMKNGFPIGDYPYIEHLVMCKLNDPKLCYGVQLIRHKGKLLYATTKLRRGVIPAVFI